MVTPGGLPQKIKSIGTYRRNTGICIQDHFIRLDLDKWFLALMVTSSIICDEA